MLPSRITADPPPHLIPQISVEIIPFVSPSSSPRVSPIARSHLRRFVGHLWSDSTSRSFASVVKSESAPIVRVAMHRGAGRRGAFGQGRGGFGAGRQGRGGGRTGARDNVWEWAARKEDDCRGEAEVEREDANAEQKDPDQESENTRWEHHEKSHEQEKKEWKKDGEGTSTDAEKIEQRNTNLAPHEPPRANQNRAPHNNQRQDRVPCENCGLFNHQTRDCRRMLCEICGLGNHVAYNCKKCLSWNVGPELCATQVEDQSFFFIEENIDPKMAREKDSTATISIVEGYADGKDIFLERSVVGFP